MSDSLNNDQKLQYANQLLQENKINEALGALKNIIDSHPDYGPAFNHLGWIYATYLEGYDKAQYYYRLALQNSPEYSPVYINYAALLNSIGKYDEAEKILSQADKLESINRPQLFYEKGILLELKEQYIEAIKMYHSAIKTSVIMAEINRYRDAIQRCQIKIALFEMPNTASGSLPDGHERGFSSGGNPGR